MRFGFQNCQFDTPNISNYLVQMLTNNRPFFLFHAWPVYHRANQFPTQFTPVPENSVLDSTR